MVSRDGTTSRTGSADVTSAEVGLKGVWGRSSIVHPYAVVGGGYYSIHTSDTGGRSGSVGFTGSGGLELNLARSLTAFGELSALLGRSSDDQAFAMRHLRFGLSYEFQRAKYGRPR